MRYCLDNSEMDIIKVYAVWGVIVCKGERETPEQEKRERDWAHTYVCRPYVSLGALDVCLCVGRKAYVCFSLSLSISLFFIYPVFIAFVSECGR